MCKAFDTVSIMKFVYKKIHYYGIRGLLLFCSNFEDYLRNKQQFVKINNTLPSNAESTRINYWTSFISLSYLFNDITNCSTILKFILFADDTSVFTWNKDLKQLEDTINQELFKLSSWFKANKLSLNMKNIRWY